MNNGLEQAEKAITEVCETLKASDAIPRAIDAFRDFLLEKNKAYGNSIYEPVRVFTNASIETLILVRLNDKATRLLKGESGGEDSFDDLLGYLILRKALPLYLESKEANGCVDVNPRTVPGFVVTESLKNRGLRVGMTYQEVRDNKWTECEAALDSIDATAVGPCTKGDPCSACKFLDVAMCTCGEPFTLHRNPLFAERDTHDFSLASWTPEPSDEDQTTVPHGLDPSEGIRTQSNERNEMLEKTAPIREYAVSLMKELGAGGASMHLHVSTPDLLRFASSGEDGETCEKIRLFKIRTENPSADSAPKKTRINRATWHETAGAACIGRVLGLLRSNAQLSWAIGELANRSGFVQSEVGFALRHLIETGAVVQHGKAKGTRYAVAGFTDWPAPLPRGKKTDDQFADEEPSIIIGAHGAT